jgi:hypothetical protein
MKVLFILYVHRIISFTAVLDFSFATCIYGLYIDPVIIIIDLGNKLNEYRDTRLVHV